MSKLPLLGLLFLVDYAIGSCGTCQKNFVACHSESTFSLCIDGSPTASTVTCPADMVCTDQPSICVSRLDNSVGPACNTGCGVCSSHGQLFSCVGPTSFALCFGQAEPFSTSKGSCVDGYVCDLSSRTICVKEADSKPSCIDDFIIDTTTSSSTSTTTTVETTTRAPRDAQTFCNETAASGLFKAEGDTTCKKYNYCTQNGSTYNGIEYNCGIDFFDSAVSRCVRTRPDNC